MHVTRRGLLAGAATTAMANGAMAGAARAEGEWPTRPIRLVVPFAAGGAADSAARAITPVMAQRLGQTIVVENRTGAGGSVGAGAVAQAPGDGYTLLWDASSHLVNPALMKGLPFDYASFIPVSLVVSFPGVLAVKADFPGRRSTSSSAGEGKARRHQRRHPGQCDSRAYRPAAIHPAGGDRGDPRTLSRRGGCGARPGGRAIDAVFITTVSAGPIVDSGRARFLAVATLERVPSRPDVPTLAESGFPGFDSNEWAALFGPGGHRRRSWRGCMPRWPRPGRCGGEAAPGADRRRAGRQRAGGFRPLRSGRARADGHAGARGRHPAGLKRHCRAAARGRAKTSQPGARCPSARGGKDQGLDHSWPPPSRRFSACRRQPPSPQRAAARTSRSMRRARYVRGRAVRRMPSNGSCRWRSRWWTPPATWSPSPGWTAPRPPRCRWRWTRRRCRDLPPPTKAFEDALVGGRMAILSLPGRCRSRAGCRWWPRTSIIGAVGVSGGTSAEDGQVAAAAVAAR